MKINYALLCVYSITTVFWCISSGYSCSKILCKTWHDYLGDINGYRSNGGVDHLTTKQLSCVPFIGMSSFYRGNIFNGCCEVINTIMAMISLLTMICLLTPLCYTRHITNGIAVCITFVTAILDLAKLVHMKAIGSVDIQYMKLSY